MEQSKTVSLLALLYHSWSTCKQQRERSPTSEYSMAYCKSSWCLPVLLSTCQAKVRLQAWSHQGIPSCTLSEFCLHWRVFLLETSVRVPSQLLHVILSELVFWFSLSSGLHSLQACRRVLLEQWSCLTWMTSDCLRSQPCFVSSETLGWTVSSEVKHLA